MDHGSVKLWHTNGNIEKMDNSNSVTPQARPRQLQEDLQADHIDTDVELDGDVGEPYKTPVALQKKKRTLPAPVTESSESEGEDSEVERKKQKVIEKKRNKGATQVRSLFLLITKSDINSCPNIETITGNRSSVSCRFYFPRQLMFAWTHLQPHHCQQEAVKSYWVRLIGRLGQDSGFRSHPGHWHCPNDGFTQHYR